MGKIEVYRSPWFDHNGYRAATVFYDDGSRGTVLEHRERMEMKLGRKLDSDEVVHHKDHDRKNNRLSNLEVISRSEHASHHNKQKGVSVTIISCDWCGEEFERLTKRVKENRKKGITRAFCNNSCKSAFAGSISKPPT